MKGSWPEEILFQLAKNQDGIHVGKFIPTCHFGSAVLATVMIYFMLISCKCSEDLMNSLVYNC
jgi:hypothetical protein